MIKTQEAKVVNILRLCPKNSEYLHGYHLENPRIGYRCNASNFALAGWALGKNNFSVVAIEVFNNGKFKEKVLLKKHRQDVKTFYANKKFIQDVIGFSTFLKISEISEENKLNEIIMQACLSNGKTIKLFKIELLFQEVENHGPDFIVIGAMKAATSAIYEYLMQHPQVKRRLPKELHFFTLKYEKGLDWYLSQFTCDKEDGIGQKLLIGEASPSYLPSQKAPGRIYKFFPNVKLIISLRNPTDRAISHYYHQRNRVKDENRPIELAFSPQEISDLAKKPYSKTNSYLQHGKYASQIKNWFDVFPRNQILLLDYQNLEKKPDDFIKKIFNFLDIQDYLISDKKKIYSNVYPETPLVIKKSLDDFFKPYNKQLENLLDTKLEW